MAHGPLVYSNTSLRRMRFGTCKRLVNMFEWATRHFILHVTSCRGKMLLTSPSTLKYMQVSLKIFFLWKKSKDQISLLVYAQYTLYNNIHQITCFRYGTWSQLSIVQVQSKKKQKHTPQTFFVDVNKISVNNIKLAFGAKLDLDYDEKWSQWTVRRLGGQQFNDHIFFKFLCAIFEATVYIGINYHSIVKKKMTHMYNCIQALQFEYFPTCISLYTTLFSKEIYIYNIKMVTTI